jgi:RNA polymerase sigma-70 factor, ECF subfamily
MMLSTQVVIRHVKRPARPGIVTSSTPWQRHFRPHCRMDRDRESARAAEASADLLLVQAALRGDDIARVRLVDRLSNLPALIRAKHRKLGSPLSPDQLEDVTQNVLLALWEKLASFDGRVPLPAWAVGFGAFEILKALGRKNRHRERTGELPDVIDPRQPLDVEAGDRLASMLSRLPPEDLDILQAKHIEGRTFTEIAARIGCPAASVKTRYYRALEAIRRRLPAEDEERT